MLSAGPIAVDSVFAKPKYPIPSANRLFGTISETTVPEALVVALNPIPCKLLITSSRLIEKATTYERVINAAITAPIIKTILRLFSSINLPKKGLKRIATNMKKPKSIPEIELSPPK